MRSRFIKSLRARLAFVLIPKIYMQMYADTGIATNNARVSRSARWARWLAKQNPVSGCLQPYDAASPSPRRLEYYRWGGAERACWSMSSQGSDSFELRA